MKALVISIALLLMAGCETLPLQSNHASDQTRYVCYTYDYPGKHVLTLPVPENFAEVAIVEVWVQCNTLSATYIRKGLSQYWAFDDDRDLYVEVDPDNDAQYWDFSGAAEGETRKPESVFECKKRT